VEENKIIQINKSCEDITGYTLDEVREADVLLHVVDISHPNFEDHYHTVNKILAEIESADKPTIVVFNKIDAYKHIPEGEFDYTNEEDEQHVSLEDLNVVFLFPQLTVVFVVDHRSAADV